MARSLGGTDADKIDCGSSSILNPNGGSASMTLVCWAYAVAFSHSYNILFQRVNAANNRYYVIQPKSTGKAAMYFTDQNGNSHAYDGTGTYTLSTGIWYHIAFVIRSTGASSGYVNGALDGNTLNTSGGLPVISGPTLMGWNDHGADSGWNGRIADAAIYNVDLTINELLSLAKGARPYQIRPTALVGYWPLDGLQSPEPDLSGNANNGTLTGTAFASGPPVTMFRPRWPSNVETAAAPSFIPAWAAQSNLPIIGAGTY